MWHHEVTRFLGKRVRVHQRSGEVFTGFLQLADERLLRTLQAQGHIEGDRVYQVRSSVRHPGDRSDQLHDLTSSTIARIELF